MKNVSLSINASPLMNVNHRLCLIVDGATGTNADVIYTVFDLWTYPFIFRPIAISCNPIILDIIMNSCSLK